MPGLSTKGDPPYRTCDSTGMYRNVREDMGRNGMDTIKRRYITVELVRRANRALIEGKNYPPHIEESVTRFPHKTAEEINEAWARVNGKNK